MGRRPSLHPGGVRAVAGAGRGDASVALVSAMHPAVLSFWLATPRVPEPYQGAWESQRERACRAAGGGAWWGTITSEPGSGGDVARTRPMARAVGGAGEGAGGQARYRLSGHKHFGSGSGITSYVLTSARPAAAEGAPAGARVTRTGFSLMCGTSPGTAAPGCASWPSGTGTRIGRNAKSRLRLRGLPRRALRLAGAPGRPAGGRGAICGVLLHRRDCRGGGDGGGYGAQERLGPRRESLRASEGVEWTRAVTEGWLIARPTRGCCGRSKPGTRTAAWGPRCGGRRPSPSWRRTSWDGYPE